MKRQFSYIIVAVVSFFVGATSIYVWDASTFNSTVYGDQLRYGIVDPVHAVNHLVMRGNGVEQRAASQYLLEHRNYATAEALDEAATTAAADVRPMIDVARGRFLLAPYRNHPDGFVRISALHASRFWDTRDKITEILPFLNDPDDGVVSQAIFELGEIGDPSVLPQLMNPTFDDYGFIDEVRQQLQAIEQQRRRDAPDQRLQLTGNARCGEYSFPIESLFP